MKKLFIILALGVCIFPIDGKQKDPRGEHITQNSRPKSKDFQDSHIFEKELDTTNFKVKQLEQRIQKLEENFNKLEKSIHSKRLAA